MIFFYFDKCTDLLKGLLMRSSCMKCYFGEQCSSFPSCSDQEVIDYITLLAKEVHIYRLKVELCYCQKLFSKLEQSDVLVLENVLVHVDIHFMYCYLLTVHFLSKIKL